MLLERMCSRAARRVLNRRRRIPAEHIEVGGLPRPRHPSLLEGPRRSFVAGGNIPLHAILDLRSSPDHPLGDAVERFIRREDAERFIEDVRRDDPELASFLRIEERELDVA